MLANQECALGSVLSEVLGAIASVTVQEVAWLKLICRHPAVLTMPNDAVCIAAGCCASWSWLHCDCVMQLQSCT